MIFSLSSLFVSLGINLCFFFCINSFLDTAGLHVSAVSLPGLAHAVSTELRGHCIAELSVCALCGCLPAAGGPQGAVGSGALLVCRQRETARPTGGDEPTAEGVHH